MFHRTRGIADRDSERAGKRQKRKPVSLKGPKSKTPYLPTCLRENDWFWGACIAT